MYLSHDDALDCVTRRNMSAVEDKRPIRLAIEAQTAEFLARGGSIDRPDWQRSRCVPKFRPDGSVSGVAWAEGAAPANLVWCSTRATAQRMKQQYYNTGKPCAYGHTGPRYTSSGKCARCQQIARARNRQQSKREAA